MPFPIAHGIIGASLFAATQKRLSRDKDIRLMLLAAGLAMLPDLDFLLTWVFDLHGWHRSFTHSIVFAVVTGLVASHLAAAKSFRAAIGLVLAPLSHGLLDALMTSGKGAGVELLWPISEHRFNLGLFDYFSFSFDPRIDLWTDILIYVLKVTLLEAILVGPMLFVILAVKLKES
jgi:inner membrane protein